MGRTLALARFARPPGGAGAGPRLPSWGEPLCGPWRGTGPARPRRFRAGTVVRANADAGPGADGNEGEFRFELDGRIAGGKARLDAFLASRVEGASRAKVQDTIRAGLIRVNGAVQTKVSYAVQPSDIISGRMQPRQPLEALPEHVEGALDIVFEDDHILVVNKPPHVVVHPAAGNYSGTLVNAVLHHMGAPGIRASSTDAGLASTSGRSLQPWTLQTLASLKDSQNLAHDDDDDDVLEQEDGSEAEDDGTELRIDQHATESEQWQEASISGGAIDVPGLDVIRPGIVHRIDKGTSGLLVIAKDAHAEYHLSAQFKAHSVKRVYLSILCGTPPSQSGVVEAPIGRDPNDRKRMAVLYPSSRQRSRKAVSRLRLRQCPYRQYKGTMELVHVHWFEVITELCHGAASLVKWQLRTGRTHQIRVHAKHIGHPILGDSTYGGATAKTMERLLSKTHAQARNDMRATLQQLARPCLHAATLGFIHPHTLEPLHFEVPPPDDFRKVQKTLEL